MSVENTRDNSAARSGVFGKAVCETSIRILDSLGIYLKCTICILLIFLFANKSGINNHILDI